MTINAIDYLESDHKKVLKMLDDLAKLEHKDTRQKRELFAAIRKELELHELVEEKLLYPDLVPDDKALILEAEEEHHVVDILLDELTNTEMKSDVWQAKLKVLKENLEHHIKEEREEVFPLAKEHFGNDKLQTMAKDMQAMKKAEQSA